MHQKKFHWAVFAFPIVLAGCASLETAAPVDQDKPQGEAVEPALVVPDMPPPPDSTFVALMPGSSLANITKPLAQTAIQRSSAIQVARAARASTRAIEASRLPQVRPTGSVSLNEPDSATVGIALEQTLWDAGRRNARLTEQELRYANAILEAWAEQNELVQSGLEAYVTLAEADAKLGNIQRLTEDLNRLSKTLNSRIEGGVADRGEALKIDIALQEVEREKLTTESQRRIAIADLASVLPSDQVPSRAAESLEKLIKVCNRNWPDTEPPADAIARLAAERQKVQEDLTRSRRFPRLVMAAGAAIGAAATPGVGVQIDASDMLGPGARATMEAAQAETSAALVRYNGQKIQTRSDLEQLEAEHASLKAEERALRGLIAKNTETYRLFLEQVEAATVEIADGIGLFQEAADTRSQLAATQAAITRNCIRSASARGYLQPIGGFDGEN